MAACVVLPLGPACVNISGVRAGDRNQFTATILNKGEPVDLTDLTLTAQARRKSTDTEALDAVVEVVDPPTDGKITVRWPGDAVRDWLGTKAHADGVWDLQLESSGADPTTIMAGAFGADMDVTRP